MAFAAAGCVTHRPVVEGGFLTSSSPVATSAPGPLNVVGSDVIRISDAEAIPVTEGPLTLERLLSIALERHPELGMAFAKAEAARGKLIQAGLYPNPRLSWDADEMGSKGNGAGEQGPLIQQEIVTAGKLELAQAAAAQGVAAADWEAVTKRYELITRVKLAFYEVLVAQREVKESEELLRIAEDHLKATEQIAPRFGTRMDILRSRIELDQSRIRLATARQRAEAAWKLLAASVGVPDLQQKPLEGTLEARPPVYAWQPALQAVLTRSSEVQEAQARVLQAQAEVARAFAQVHPNVHASIRPFYAFPEEDMRLMVQAGVALPLFDRNQGNILAAQADVTRAVAEARNVELKLTERLTQAFQRYETARQQVEAYTRKDGILENARESHRLYTLAYKAGDAKFDATTFLDSQRTLAQTRLAYLQALGELWRAAAEIAGLMQEEHK
jgi:cobalt-zinc-cadmium efflux system outer membrane protein